jgi:gamma-glutamyltranspeptidase/glutathione hydrolase
MLKRGGSAVDAAIAANAVLSFAEPFMCGPGGDLFAIVWDPRSHRLHGLNASGRAPGSLSYDALIDKLGAGTRQMPFHGPFSVTVPGAVDGWYRLHERFGRLDFSTLLAPAIEYARAGLPTPEIVAADWQGLIADHRSLPHASAQLENYLATYTIDGRPPAKGELFQNEALARLFENLAAEGRDYFYQGAAARAIADCVQRFGGALTAADLAAHRSDWVDPVSVEYRGFDVFEMPPNGQGIAALEMLNLLEGYDLRSMGRASADYWHLLVEAKKLAYEDRARHYADPEFMQIAVADLLSKDYASELRAGIRLDRAMASVEDGAEAIKHGDTVYLTTADRDGMLVSLIQSIAAGFGSTLIPDDLGFALQNRGSGFALEPGHPNQYRAGRRPFHTIIPGFVMQNRQPLMAFGVMGGHVQPQGHAQVLINIIDFELDLQAAGDAARCVHSGSSGPGQRMHDGGQVIVEPGVPAAVLESLQARGHQITLARSGFGGYQAIRRDPGTGALTGATEMRKDGAAAGY